MELYFVRHGIAADRPPSGTDNAERPLTTEGVERMQASARALRQLGVAPEVLLTSPYTRARQTAEILGAELKRAIQLADLLSPGFSIAGLMQVLAPFSATPRIMLVGHEPDFSDLVGLLTGGKIEMKRGSVCRVDLVTLTPGSGTMIWLLPPRVLRSIT